MMHHTDIFKNLRKLPLDLQKDLHIFLVDRLGKSENAYMRTENIIGYVKPKTTYRLELTGMIEDPDLTPPFLPSPIAPPRTELTGHWESTIDLTIEDANILGGNGRYILNNNQNKLVIPVAEATPEHLAYYNSYLVKIGEAVSFESTGNLPLTVTSIGESYVEDYLLDKNKGGGAYLEVHDRPHFHMPLDENCSGYLIIGKEIEGSKKEISAFKVPYGYGIHMGPWAIHSDSFLVGRYVVIFSATPDFSTVIIRKENGELADVSFN